MTKLMLSAAAVALCLGTAAYAQDQDKTTTTTTQTPAGTTQTSTHETTDADGYVKYRKTVTSTRRYDAAAFNAPSGFTYRRFTVGDHVPNTLLGDGVVLSNYGDYALVSPPTGLTWIRDGQDALLVDVRTGEVIQADYDLFKG
jgi:Ni/Co efflux regulator RcnB